MIVILLVNSINLAFFAQTSFTASSIKFVATVRRSLTLSARPRPSPSPRSWSAARSAKPLTSQACRLVLSLHRNTLNSPGATKRTGKDSFWQGASALQNAR